MAALVFRFVTRGFGFESPAHQDRQAEAAVLVDHVQELESAAIGCSI